MSINALRLTARASAAQARREYYLRRDYGSALKWALVTAQWLGILRMRVAEHAERRRGRYRTGERKS